MKKDHQLELFAVGALSERGAQWLRFSKLVHQHVEEYSVKQYGDMPHDQASAFTPSEITMNMKRYLNR